MEETGSLQGEKEIEHLTKNDKSLNSFLGLGEIPNYASQGEIVIGDNTKFNYLC